MKRLLNMILSLFLLFPMTLNVFAEESTETNLIDSSTVWKYLDDNTDPAGDSAAEGYNRTSWTAEDYDDSSWKTGNGPFGSKRGTAAYDSTHTATTVLNGCDQTNDTPAYFFRTAFTVTDLDRYTSLKGSLEYDDGAIVYINGQRVAAGHDIACDENGNVLGHGFDANMQYGGSNQGPDTLTFSLADLSILHEGVNTVAVEIHNGRKTSSDVWFSFSSLTLTSEDIDYQNNVSLSVGADETQMNFTWYSPLDEASLTVSENKDMTGGNVFDAAVSVANDGQYSCKATVTGLQANTVYYYQLANKGKTSDVYSFTTGNDTDFSFALAGDPQIGASGNADTDAAGWENTLNILADNDLFSDISFLISAGDQVNTAESESQYDGYLDHNALLSLPVATAIGNHDSGSNAYSQHFNVPNESTQYGVTAAGGDYYFVYNNTLFFVLNSNAQSAADVEGHKAFMEQAIAETADRDITWRVAVFHHTLFTVASHAHDSYIDSETGFKSLIVPVLQEMDIDVALMGHDHVYCRTYMMDGTKPITNYDGYEYADGTAPVSVTGSEGILYVTANSASGSKTYTIKDETFDFSAVQNQENSANISKVTVTDSEFTVTTYRTSDMSVVDSFTVRKEAETDEKDIRINHVYGGGAKGDTPISNSFIELYNPNDTEVSLEGYSLVYDNKTLELTGTVPANGSYLVVGAAETTTDEFLTYDLPEADRTCDWAINNKTYTIELKYGDTAVDTFTATGKDDTKISKQKSLKKNADGSYSLIVWEKTSVTVDEEYVAANAPRNTKGAYGSVHGAQSEEEPSYTPVQTSDVRVKGYYNEDGNLNLELAGRYNSGAMNADGGSLEIVQYNPVNGYAYAVSGVKGKLIAVDLNGKMDGETVTALTGTEYDVKSLVDGFAYGDMTSVSISEDGTKIAVAVQAEGYADRGIVALFKCNADGSLELLSTVTTGVQPDMVTFADGHTILTADEGEPREGVNGTDPKGSVTVITVNADDTMTSETVCFDAFDAQRDALTEKGVLVQKGKNPSEDFEPEYIAVSGNTAYVSLQEANAIAVLDIASRTFKDICPLGFVNYGEVKADLEKNDTIELKNYENVYGIRMPDGITVTELNGKTYLLTANEGDSRADWAGMDNESEGKTSPTGNVTLDSKVVWFNSTMWDGLDDSKAYVFGGRSFSMYEVTDTGLNLVYDSQSDFEEITAEVLPAYFNASNDKISMDNRSGKKGPEPETVVTGTVNGRTYAYVALERIGGIMAYDITEPENAKFVNYINSREFDSAIQGDVSPEGLCFIPAENSATGKALLLAACEVSGTLAVYEMDGPQATVPTEPEQPEETDKPEQPVYTIIEGAGSTWTEDTLTFRANGDFSKFTAVKVDGNTVDEKNYEAKSGSTVITFTADYLKTLNERTHTLTVVYTDGECSADFTVKAAVTEEPETPVNPDHTEDVKPDNGNHSGTVEKPDHSTTENKPVSEDKPAVNTGDSNNVITWFGLLAVSAAAGIFFIRKRSELN